MAKNKALQEAARAQQDEFYTDIHDIEHELMYYSKELFYDKVVLCNCDDPYESAFFEYFATSFNSLRLRKLIATCYAGSQIAQRQLSLFDENLPSPKHKPYCAVIESLQDYNGDGRKDLLDIEYILKHNEGGELRILKGDGDFRSPECIELLKEADIVVTNPPHSLLREYVAMLVKYGKQFIILANFNAVTYKEIFPLFMTNQMWLGVSNGDKHFRVPEYYEPRETRYWVDEDGQKFRSLGNMCWFTNMKHGRCNDTIFLVNKYYGHEDEYPKYDNYDAIEVSKTSDIPCDYDGVMGVPVTFLDKYNPTQFDILGITIGREKFAKEAWPTKRYINAVQHNPNGTTANGSKINTRAAIAVKNPTGVYYTADNTDEKLQILYA